MRYTGNIDIICIYIYMSIWIFIYKYFLSVLYFSHLRCDITANIVIYIYLYIYIMLACVHHYWEQRKNYWLVPLVPTGIPLKHYFAKAPMIMSGLFSGYEWLHAISAFHGRKLSAECSLQPEDIFPKIINEFNTENLCIYITYIYYIY